MQMIRRTGCDDIQAEASILDAPRILDDRYISFRFHRATAGRRLGVIPAGRATFARVPVTVGITTGM